MLEQAFTCSEPLATIQERDRDGDLWAVVLAGGEGSRLRALTRYLYGDERPKQYAVLTGSKSLLRQTLERVARLVPPSRIVVVAQASHDRYLGAELAGFPQIHVLAQPSDRGTAAGVLMPAHWIRARDPRAVVAVFPADHFILEEETFMRHVGEVAGYVRAHPEGLVLLGVPPSDADPDCGWIEPGVRVGWAGPDPVHRIRGFREKPTEESARRLYALGGLWNTFVFASSVTALIDAGRECVPCSTTALCAWGSSRARSTRPGPSGRPISSRRPRTSRARSSSRRPSPSRWPRCRPTPGAIWVPRSASPGPFGPLALHLRPGSACSGRDPDPRPKVPPPGAPARRPSRARPAE